jgi:hypothetical protein
MTLLIDELFDGVTFEQNFRIRRSMQLAHFRPWIIKWGTPASGEMVLQVLQDSEVLKEVRLTAAEINAGIPSTYFHGQLRFDTSPLQLNHDRKAEFTEYTIKLFMDGNTDDTDNFFGVVRRYEQKFYDTYGDGVVNNEAPNDMVEPLGFELFEWSY